MTSLDKFNISNVSKQLNKINVKLSIANSIPFPCLVLLSNYTFTCDLQVKKRFVKILPNGDVQGGFAKMIISLIDFSFVRSMCASCHSIKSPPAYDPVSLFLLELFRYIDRHQNMDKFLKSCEIRIEDGLIADMQAFMRISPPRELFLILKPDLVSNCIIKFFIFLLIFFSSFK